MAPNASLADWQSLSRPQALAALAGPQLFAADALFLTPHDYSLDGLNLDPANVARGHAQPEVLNTDRLPSGAETGLAGAPGALLALPVATTLGKQADTETAALLLAAGLVSSGAPSGPQDIEIRQVDVRTNDLVFNPYDGYVYASVPSIAGVGLGNTLAAINPYKATVDGAVFIGSEPTKLAISDDGRYVYADLQGAAAIRRFDLTTWEADLQFPLTPGGQGFSWVEDMEVQPGNSSVVAVSRRNRCCSPRHAGVVIYVDGVALPQQNGGGSNSIEFGETGERLYGYVNEVSSFSFNRMEVAESGVRVLDSTGGLISGFGVNIVHEAGRIYTTTGQVIDAETRTLAGTYAGVGFGSLIRPDTANGVTYVLSGNTLRLFDQATFTPVATYTIPGVSGSVSSLIRWGDDGLAFRTDTRVFLVTPSRGGAPSGGGLLPSLPVRPTPVYQPPAAGPGSIQIRTLTLPTNDLVYNPYDGYLYASVPSSAGAQGNSIAVIDPWVGELVYTVFVGSEPGPLAISDNGQYLYAALQGAGAVRRFNTQTWEAEIQFSLGAGYRVEDMLVLPGIPESVAISRRNTCCSPRHEGVAIYDNGVQRPLTTPGHTGSNRIEPSAYYNRFYGLNTETTEFGFRRMEMNEQGVRVVDVSGSPVYAFNLDIVYDAGLLYWNVGTILDPEERLLVGTYSGLGFGTLLRPDTNLGQTFALSDNLLRVFDQATFVPVASFTLPGIGGGSTSLVSLASAGLAFRNGNRVIFADFV